ncbi:MAG: type II toxin-antitoxin system death-on-curing family toxin [Methanoregulaceae archaeon]|nr:type II toxin-antitoxin system death-on-curing family toxin [Methanoregulaceae archaeon]HPJ13432.1 type II toxin-antitoxin system death-on-curing family toxin [Caldisericia bacterium]
MNGPTVERVIAIHNDIVEEFGGASGVRDIATIDYLIYRLNRESAIFSKASIALHMICSEHPFVDGNKRTAFVVADNLLKDEGYHIQASNDEVIEFMLEVAQYIHTEKSVKKWIKRKAVLKTA